MSKKDIESLHEKCILITGASGFVGRQILEAFSGILQKSEIRLHLDLVTRDVNLLKQTLLSLSLQKNFTVNFISSSIGRELVPTRPVDYVFHLATPASAVLNRQNPELMLMLNIQAAQWICNSKHLTESIPKVIFASSGAVYGGQQESNSLITEDCKFAPNTMSPGMAYAEGKRVAELILIEAGQRNLLIPTIARMFTFSGPGLPLDRHFAIGNFVHDAIHNQSIIVRGDGTSERSYLDSRDMAGWLIKTLGVDVPSFALHIGSEEATSISHLAHLVASRYQALTNADCSVSILGTKSELDGFDHYVPSTKRTREHLGVEATISLADSIDDMIRNEMQ
jgi:nucleoside-diphosphate-sugar epimerase